MSCLAYTPRRSENKLIKLGATATLAFLLCTVSHQALAACTLSGTAGVAVDCSDESELPTGAIPSVSNIDGANSTQVGVDLLTDGTELENATDITSQVTDPNTRNTYSVYGVRASLDDGEFEIENEGNITAVHNGVGNVAAIGAIGDVGELSVVNFGSISVTRGTFTVTTNTAASLQGNAGVGAANLGVAAAIYNNEEEMELLVVTNSGEISASGTLTAGIYSRANGLIVVNEEDGVISATGDGSAAISSHDGNYQTDEDGFRQYIVGNSVIVNEGEINGDIQVVDANGLRYMASRLAGYDPLTLTSQANRRDSTIINSGEITGNIYLGAGNHVLINTEEGEIEGDIDVDQRRNFTYTVNNPNSLDVQIYRGGEGPADDDDGGDDDDEGTTSQVFDSISDFLDALPAHHFEFDFAGEVDGNVGVHTNVTSGDSTIVLRPHITGSGAGSDIDNPSEESGHITGTLAIGYDGVTSNGYGITLSSIDTTTTLTPVIDSVVHSGEWFLVAQNLFGALLPTVEEDSFLVDWEAAQNASSSLVIGATVADASIVAGLSSPGIATLNALMATDGSNPDVNALAAAVQNLSDEDDVRVAGEQLAPETNFATQQSAITLAFLTGQHIDNRLAGVGATAPASEFAAPSGLGMKQPQPEGRMSLGAYDDEAPVVHDAGRGGLWGQAFGAGLDQDQNALVEGYESHIYGAMAGVDNWVTPGVRLGVAGGYAYTGIDGDGVTQQNETSDDTYLVLAYGAIKGAGWYASGRAGYARHQYDTTRVLTVPFDDVASASHDADQYMAALEVGAPLHFLGSALTPVASLNWTRLEQDGYTESGIMGLTVAAQETDSLQSGLGVKVSTAIAADTLLQGRAIWYHEFEDTNQQVTAAFADASSFTVAGPDVGRDTAALGVGLFAYTGWGTSFQLNYDALLREDFIGHTGSGRLLVEF
jgi:uncharacterized protein with beta-barrel porin domain